jgi:hypothetical protein
LRFFFLIIAALTAFGTATPASAQGMPVESLVGFTETEKVGFAFYHLINKEPPYMDWIQARDDYIKGNPKERMDIMDEQRFRLRDGFANYRVDRDMVMVKLPLSYTLIDNPDYLTDSKAQNRGLIKRLIIKLPDDKIPYFPFTVGKFWVGVIPNDLAKPLEIDLNEEDYKNFSHGIVDGTNFKNKGLFTTIIMKPLQADAKAPMMEGNMPVFLMLSDIASLSIRGLSEELLWGWTAPWFMNSKSQELMTLHK